MIPIGSHVRYKYGENFYHITTLIIRSHHVFFGENFYQINGSDVWIPESSFIL